MEHKNLRTESTEAKKDTRVDIDNRNNEMNKDVKKDVRSDEMKRDTKVDIDSKNHEVNKDARQDSVSSAELDSFVKKIHYPVKKQEILDTARKDGSSEKITNVLQMIQEKYYSSADELTRELASVV